MKSTPLSEPHRAQLTRAVELALPQWLKPVPESPEAVVVALERVLLFLRQNGSPSAQARQIASLAFAWGEQVARASGWSWQSVSDDGSVNPSLVSPDGRFACLPVDVVTTLVMKLGEGSLTSLFRLLLQPEPRPASWAVVSLAE